MSLRTALRQNRTRTRRLTTAGVVAASAVTLGVTGMTGSASAADTGSAQAIAQEMVGDPVQYQCFSNIVQNESGWDPSATNPESGAYGLVQALPAEKMATAGSDWQTNPATQIEWGLGYMNERYGSPCDAWAFWQANGWY